MAVLGLVALGGCGGVGGPQSAEPAPTGPPSSTASASAPGAVTPSGFDQVAAQVVDANGRRSAFCLWLAADDVARTRGLQGVTSLGECPGMAFVYPEPVEHRFWMRDTLIPLTITFWDADGRLVSTADMAPCPATAPECPLTAPAGAYQVAVEVPVGEAARLGLVAGSTLTLGR